MAPYTYWYDHAPLGWIFIALWVLLTKGFFTFGFSLNSGRIFMLVLHLIDVVVLFGITKKLFKSSLAGIIAVLIFSLSPLAIFFQRRILLDNLMTFWFLLSTYLVLGNNRKLSHFFFSAVCFGIAVLSKETAIFFLPAFIYIIYNQTDKYHRKFVFLEWIVVTGFIISGYLLYAALKGELFPSGTLLGGTNNHVSLLQSIFWQSERKGGFFLSPQSAFLYVMGHWMKFDALIILFGIFATFINIGFAIKDKTFRIISILTLSLWLFFIRGGILIDFYVIPLIPLLALSIGAAIAKIVSLVKSLPGGNFINLVLLATLEISFGLYYYHNLDVYTVDQTRAQLQAVAWIQKNVPANSIIASDNYAYLDLNKNISDIYSPQGAQYYWKIDTDPQVQSDVLNHNWENVQYVLATEQMQYDVFHAELPVAKKVYLSSKIIKSFPGNGWDIDIRKVNNN